MKPIIIVNFKAYKQATGDKALILAKIHDNVAMKTKSRIMVAVQNTDLFRVSKAVSIPVLAQHADPVEFGAHTGSDLPEDLKQNGAWGVLINHSEDRMKLHEIKNTIARCKEARLKTLVCAETISKAYDITKMKPNFLAFEDPVLIGTGNSVSKAKPLSVCKFADMVKKANKTNSRANKKSTNKKQPKTISLCGAGITSREDIEKAMELGMQGVLLASAVATARNPEKILEGLVGKKP